VKKALKAHEIAAVASELVGGDRDRQHGQKRDNFVRIASVWQSYLEIRRDKTAPLGPADVGHMMVLMKIARTQSGAVNPDDYIDAAGYAACAGEIACQEAVDQTWVDAAIEDEVRKTAKFHAQRAAEAAEFQMSKEELDIEWEKAKRAREAVDTL